MIKVPDLLTESEFLTLSTCCDNVPWCSTVFFWMDHKRVFFVSREDSKHVQNIIKNDQVSFSIFNATMKQGIQTLATAEILTDEKELFRVVKLGGEKHLRTTCTEEMIQNKVSEYKNSNRVVIGMSINKCYISMWNEKECYDYRMECQISDKLKLQLF